MKKTLLVLAAGLGSRYGGLKQLDTFTFGPNGELLLEYSIFDAMKAGFNKIVFVIQKSFENDFRKIIEPKLKDKIEIHFVHQQSNDIPLKNMSNTSREKPWGTAHAVWAARSVIKEPFVVINADDYYGKHSYQVARKFLMQKSEDFAVLGYHLGGTLSDFGGVNRGICFSKEDPKKLSKIIEVKGIRKDSKGTLTFKEPQDFYKNLAMDEVVSMNMFCLTPIFFIFLEKLLVEFLKSFQNEPDAELLIPHIIDHAIENTKIDTWILDAHSDWFGVTYRADKILATYKIEDKIKFGQYPKNLYKLL